MESLFITAITIVSLYLACYIYKYFIYPKLVKLDIKEIERNPSWIINYAKDNYYGFHDIDIIIAKTTLFESLPRFNRTKDKKYELWISEDVTTHDVEEVLRLALMGKLYLNYGKLYNHKSTMWLSILCYLLDGGNLKTSPIKFEKKKQ